jgi:hypothetical protein
LRDFWITLYLRIQSVPKRERHHKYQFVNAVKEIIDFCSENRTEVINKNAVLTGVKAAGTYSYHGFKE